MKEIVVISGKGGTGKTSITASFAVLAPDKVLADCDVDAADLHLILKPSIKETHEFYGMQKAYINPEKCTQCGKCKELCRFEAVETQKNGYMQKEYYINTLECEGCQVCYRACPAGAVEMKDHLAGHWYLGETQYGPMVNAKLGIAEDNSGLLVSTVKEKARKVAADKKIDLIIVDGPPGIGCPVIASLANVNAALVVTEPTLSGMHDMQRVLGLAAHFGVKPLVCINKYDLNEENTGQIEKTCQEQGVRVVGKIPYDTLFTKALVESRPVVEYTGSTAARKVIDIWEEVFKELRNI